MKFDPRKLLARYENPADRIERRILSVPIKVRPHSWPYLVNRRASSSRRIAVAMRASNANAVILARIPRGHQSLLTDELFLPRGSHRETAR